MSLVWNVSKIGLKSKRAREQKTLPGEKPQLDPGKAPVQEESMSSGCYAMG